VPREGGAARFRSILFDRDHRGGDLRETEPDFFGDLNLDQVLTAFAVGREEYELRPFFYTPLQSAGTVSYRHDVIADLEKSDVLAAVARFAEAMRRMREHLAHAKKLRYAQYELPRQAWFMESIEIYCEAVTSLSVELEGSSATSDGLRGLSDYLRQYVASESFTALVEGAAALTEVLNGIRYRIRIEGLRVTVSRYEDDADYSVEVMETFERFRQGGVKSYLVRLPQQLDVNDTEVKILELVARLHPEPFSERAEYCAQHRDFADETITRFDREVQFYIGYLELIGRLRAAGLPFCYPQVSACSKEIQATDTFDLALADKLVPENRDVVCNDFYLNEPERMLVVSGPNNGGKTTFARMFGQLHYLASLGLPVPGRSVALVLPDQIFAHFEREEEIETLRGKFEDELVRVHEILERATSSSVIVMNESFNSTTLNDALFVGTEVMLQLLDRGCIGVYVTFVDEIAFLSEATVSMVSEVAPENPAQRTFRVLRRPADGLAYASAIAEKYGLTYERLMERIGA